MVKYIIFMMSIKQLLQVTFSNNMEKCSQVNNRGIKARYRNV